MLRCLTKNSMKPFILVCFALLTFTTVALTYRSQSNELVWETNFANAIEKAKKEKKKLLLNFTGSNWCGWCMRLDKEVFSKEDFITYANQNFVCVKLDFPRGSKKLSDEETKQNNELAVAYQIKGYPTILIINPDKSVVLQTGYQFGGVKPYIEHLDAAIAPKDNAVKKK